MNRRKHGLVLLAMLLVLSVSAVAMEGGAAYLDLRRIVPIVGDAQAGREKAQLCGACHGPQGISTVPNFPSLAGQRPDYLYWELASYQRGAFPQSVMTPIVATLTEENMRDLAVYYGGLDPSPTGAVADREAQADSALVKAGEQLYLKGDTARGIPACQGCHGPTARGHSRALQADASGHTPYAVYPVLRGQLAAYLESRLAQYRAGEMRDSTADFVMTGIARRLNEGDIEAVAVWLSSLAD